MVWLNGGDGHVIPLSSGLHPVVYSTQANVQIVSGLAYPTAVEQNDHPALRSAPCRAGNYEIDLGPALQVAASSADEVNLLASGAGGVDGHPIVSVSGSTIEAGVQFTQNGLVQPARLRGAICRSIAGGSNALLGR